MRERYELCEDMVQLLAQRAAAAQFKSDGTEVQVLSRIAQSLSAAEPTLPAPEVTWVVHRLAEVLDWPTPQ